MILAVGKSVSPYSFFDVFLASLHYGGRSLIKSKYFSSIFLIPEMIALSLMYHMKTRRPTYISGGRVEEKAMIGRPTMVTP